MTSTSIGHVGHDPQVVRDHDDGRFRPSLDLLHEFQDLGLDGDVERRGRLVGDKHIGAAGQSHGYHGSLSHTARELVGIVARPFRRPRDAHPVEEFHGRRPGLAACEAPLWMRRGSAICLPIR